MSELLFLSFILDKDFQLLLTFLTGVSGDVMVSKLN